MASFIKNIPGQVTAFIPGFRSTTSAPGSGTASPERSTSPVRSNSLGSRPTSPLSTSPPKQTADPPKPWLDRIYDSIETNNLRTFNKLFSDPPYTDYCLNSVFYDQVLELTNYLIQRGSIVFLDRLSAKWPGVLKTENLLKNVVFTGNCNMVAWYLNKPDIRTTVQDAMLLELGTPQKWTEFHSLNLIRHCFDQKGNKEFQEIAKYLLDTLFSHSTFPQDGYSCALGYSRLVRLAINYPDTGTSQAASQSGLDEVINTEMVLWLTKYYNEKFRTPQSSL